MINNLLMFSIWKWLSVTYFMLCSDLFGKCPFREMYNRNEKCLSELHLQSKQIFYSQMPSNSKIWSNKRKLKFWMFEPKNNPWITIIIISCVMLFYWATLLSQEARIKLGTLPQESTLCMLSFAIQTFFYYYWKKYTILTKIWMTLGHFYYQKVP